MVKDSRALAFDVVIVGGGIVGLALAALLQSLPLRVAVLEPSPPIVPTPDIACPGSASTSKVPTVVTHQRVSAINLASETLLQRLGVWPTTALPCCSPYYRMAVWQQVGAGTLDFTAKSLHFPHLGHILEDQWLRCTLWRQLQRGAHITLLAPALLREIVWHKQTALLTLAGGLDDKLEDRKVLSAQLVVAADGAHSLVREQANIPLGFCDYPHHALTATVSTTLPHQHCAHQVFHPEHVLALLPLADPRHCSIVWSLPPLVAIDLQHVGTDSFNRQLSAACDRRLGDCQLLSERQLFPLTARYAQRFAGNRVVLVGDAAHTLHPLAGQGLNLGLAAVTLLATELQRLQAVGHDIGCYRHLRAFERHYRYEAAKLLAVTSGLQQLFTGDHPVKRRLRGIGLQIIDQLNPLKAYLVRQASGI